MTNCVSDKSQLIPQGIEKLIEDRLEHLQISDYTIEIEKGSIKGDNYLGIIATIDISGKTKNGDPTTLHWLAKSAQTHEHFRKVARIPSCYSREVFMYQTVFPEFLRLQDERNVKDKFRNFARLHVSTLESPKECIVMENMKELGFRLKDRRVALDLEHASLVMKEYGRFHALSFCLKDQKSDVFKVLADNTKEQFFHKDNVDHMRNSYARSIDRAIKALDVNDHGEVIARFEEIKLRNMEIMMDILEPNAAGKYSVITHGDCWLNNMLFKYDDNTSPKEVLFLDYQLSRIGSPCLDLSYFLFTCTDETLRDEHFDHLLDQYYQSFSNFLRELGSDPHVLFPRKILGEHMKQFSKYGVLMACIVLFLMMSESEEIPEADWEKLNEENAMRNSITNFKSKNQGRFEERIRGVVLDCFARGYL